MLKQRVVTACALFGVLAVVLLVLPYPFFVLAVSGLLVVAAWEWANLAGLIKPAQRYGYALVFVLLFAVLYALRVHEQESQTLPIFVFSVVGWLLALFALWRYPQGTAWHRPWFLALAGFWLLVPVWLGLLVLQPRAVNSLLIWLVIAGIAAADIGAYFAGKRFGRRKLAVHISPGKTWEGFWGGAAANLLLAVVVAVILHLPFVTFFGFVCAMVLIAASSVVGDLFESMVKRQRGLKDSSQLLPGHGGVMDRIDGWTAALPLFALLQLLWSGHS